MLTRTPTRYTRPTKPLMAGRTASRPPGGTAPPRRLPWPHTPKASPVVYAPIYVPDPPIPGDEGVSVLDAAWLEPATLSRPPRTMRPGVFVIEHDEGRGAWRPIYVGMSATGIGEALRWIARAPAILGAPVDLERLRVRAAEAPFDTQPPGGRERLRRWRNEIARDVLGASPNDGDEVRTTSQRLLASGEADAS